jgi:DNA helicase-2/ATP-dependent DNA helicase PcrA
MQKIFKGRALVGGSPPCDWDGLLQQADVSEQLDFPHRWSTGCADLGRWTLAAREALKAGGKIDLRTGLPPSIAVVFAENEAPRHGDYQIRRQDRWPVDAFEQSQASLLILTRHNRMARSLRGFFNRRTLLWEGYTRPGLDALVDALAIGEGKPAFLAAAIVVFMAVVSKGFSRSAFGNQFEKEACDGCTASRRGKPAKVQELARFLVKEADHRGVAKMLRRLSEFLSSDRDFADIKIDHYREFWDAIRLGEFGTPGAGLAEITHRRTYARAKPPDRAISTIHKAKGLECGSAIVMPCDASVFPDKPDGRCLLYVAISRAKSRLMLVVPRSNPSPLLLV